MDTDRSDRIDKVDLTLIHDISAYEVLIHRSGCADIERAIRTRGLRSLDVENIEFETVRGIVEYVFSNFIFANDMRPWTVRVLPCVGVLPREI